MIASFRMHALRSLISMEHLIPRSHLCIDTPFLSFSPRPCTLVASGEGVDGNGKSSCGRN